MLAAEALEEPQISSGSLWYLNASEEVYMSKQPLPKARIAYAKATYGFLHCAARSPTMRRPMSAQMEMKM